MPLFGPRGAGSRRQRGWYRRASTIRRFLAAGLINELHLEVRPVLLGSGEHLWKDIDLSALGNECVKSVAGERATRVYLQKRGNEPGAPGYSARSACCGSIWAARRAGAKQAASAAISSSEETTT